MSYKYARFFAIGGRMEWDSIKDDADLQKRILSGKEEREEFEDAGGMDALQKPGDFVKMPYMVIVRCA